MFNYFLEGRQERLQVVRLFANKLSVHSVVTDALYAQYQALFRAFLADLARYSDRVIELHLLLLTILTSQVNCGSGLPIEHYPVDL